MSQENALTSLALPVFKLLFDTDRSEEHCFFCRTRLRGVNSAFYHHTDFLGSLVTFWKSY